METAVVQEKLTQRRQAVLYARVSSEEQEKEGFSIPSQEKLLRNYAAENGIEIVNEYIDVETANGSPHRRAPIPSQNG